MQGHAFHFLNFFQYYHTTSNHGHRYSVEFIYYNIIIVSALKLLLKCNVIFPKIRTKKTKTFFCKNLRTSQNTEIVYTYEHFRLK